MTANPHPKETRREPDSPKASLHRARWFAAVAVCGLPVMVMAALAEEMRHWFVLPVMFCGAIAAADAIDWALGKMDLFDPVGLIGLLGYHFFFLSPCLYILSGTEMKNLTEYPDDWRDWLGAMAVLNGLGLLLYASTRDRFVRHFTKSVSLTVRVANFHVLVPLTAFIITCSLSAQALVYYHYGGIAGFIAAFEDTRENFTGMGVTFTVSEIFPVIAIIAYAVVMRQMKIRPSLVHVLVVLVIFFAVRLLFGGLRGSRGSSVYALFLAAGVMHIYVRQLPRSLILAGMPFILGFMYFYGFYKEHGREGLEAASSSEYRSYMGAKSGRSVTGMFLGDLSRCDVQAYLLYRFTGPAGKEFDYGMGRTYLGAAALILFPSGVWPDRPPTKVKEGTEALYGTGSYSPFPEKHFVSVRVYGLAGEAMLNFGWFAAPLSFLILSLFVAWVRSRFLMWDPADIRRILLPFGSFLACLLLAWDSDNWLFNLIKQCAFPIALIYIGSRAVGAKCLKGSQMPGPLKISPTGEYSAG